MWNALATNNDQNPKEHKETEVLDTSIISSVVTLPQVFAYIQTHQTVPIT